MLFKPNVSEKPFFLIQRSKTLRPCLTHLNFDSSLEADTIRDGGLKVCYGVELFLNLGRDGWLG